MGAQELCRIIGRKLFVAKTCETTNLYRKGFFNLFKSRFDREKRCVSQCVITEEETDFVFAFDFPELEGISIEKLKKLIELKEEISALLKEPDPGKFIVLFLIKLNVADSAGKKLPIYNVLPVELDFPQNTWSEFSKVLHKKFGMDTKCVGGAIVLTIKSRRGEEDTRPWI